jgi:hypothetical protein
MKEGRKELCKEVGSIYLYLLHYIYFAFLFASKCKERLLSVYYNVIAVNQTRGTECQLVL